MRPNKWIVITFVSLLLIEDGQLQSSPENLEVEEQRSSNILLKWDAKPNVSYRISASPDNSDAICSAGVSVKGSEYRINETSEKEPFNPRTSYKVVVCEEKRSLPIPATINCRTGPPAPSDVTVQDIDQDGCNVTWLDMDPVSGLPITHYILECFKTFSQALVKVESIDKTENYLANLNGLASNTKYSLIMTSLTNDSMTYSDPSLPVSFSTVPGKLSNLSSTIIGNSCKILVEWVKPDGGEAIDEYKVLWAPLQMSQAGEESEVIKHETSKSTYCYVINTELVYTSYNVTVLTYNNAGLSMTSTVQSTSSCGLEFGEIKHPTQECFSSEDGVTNYYKKLGTNSVSTPPLKIVLCFLASTPRDELSPPSSEITSNQPPTNCDHTKPAEPAFNMTATLTNITLNWLPLDVDYFVIETDPETKVFKTSSTSYTIDEVIPYTDYIVFLYSVIIDHGEEIRSTRASQKCFTYSEVLCPLSQLTNVIYDVTVTFPATNAGYCTSSVEVCLTNSSETVKYLAVRSCALNGDWLEATWLSSCDSSLKSLASTNITGDKERNQVASDLVILTSNSSSLTDEDTKHSVQTIESLTNVEELDKNTTFRVVTAIGNLLSLSKRQLHIENYSNRLLTSLDDVAAKVILEEESQFVSPSVALAVTSNNISGNGIGFLQRNNPLEDKLGFSSEEFDFFNHNMSMNQPSLFLPKQAFENNTGDRISFYVFRDDNAFSSNEDQNNFASVLSKTIFSASVVGKQTTNLYEDVVIIFEMLPSDSEETKNTNETENHFCGFWNEAEFYWSDEGCSLSSINNELVTCHCNHLTNFATLFASGNSDSIRTNYGLDVATIIGCSISMMGSLATITAYLIVWRSKKLLGQRKTLFLMLNLSLSLFFLYGFLLISFVEDVYKDEDACTAIAVILHFFLFSSLSWMMVEAVYVFIGTTKPLYFRSELSNTKVWSVSIAWGWGFPALFIGLSAGIKISSYKKLASDSSNACWIQASMMIYLIVIPAALILTVNLIVYIVVVKTYVSNRFGHKQNLLSGKNIAFSLTLFVTFGISWLFGFLIFDSSTNSEVFAYIFTITSSLQGLILFLLFVVRRKDVRVSIAQEFQTFHSQTFNADQGTKSTAFGEFSSKSLKSITRKWERISR